MNPLTTSLAEIKSFHPCYAGWINLLAHRNAIAISAGKSEADLEEKFPLVSCLESNSISDVLWLIGKRKVEIQIAVRFARMCADSVAHLKSAYAANANAYTAAANAANAYAAYAANAAANAATAATATAAAANANDANDATADANAAYTAAAAVQKEKNKQFLIQCINEFPSIQHSPIHPAPSI